MEETTDGELVADVLAGNKQRFQMLVTRYERALLQVAKSRLGSAEAAEDVVQESFLCAFRFLASYDSKYTFRTWLWTILLNQCNRDYRRKTRRVDHVVADDLPIEPQDTSPTPESRALTMERNELLDELMHELPTARADALRLRFFGGLKFKEIANAMGCSISTAKNRVRWGLEEIGNRIRDRENVTDLAETPSIKHPPQ